MKHLKILAVFLSLINFSYSQNATSIFSIGGVSVDGAKGLTTDSNGNLYVLGIASGEIKMNGVIIPTIYNSSIRTYIAKLDANKNLIWFKELNYYPTSSIHGARIKVDQAGNIYVTDRFYLTFDVPPFNFSFSGHSVVTYKLDPSGNILWAKEFGGEEMDIRDNSILEIRQFSSRSDSVGNELITNELGTVTWLNMNGDYIDHVQVDDPNFATEEVYGRNTNNDFFIVRRPLAATTAPGSFEILIYDSLGIQLDSNLTHYSQSTEVPKSMVQNPITKDYYMVVQLYDRTPLNSVAPIFDKQFCILRLDENLNVVGRLNLSGYVLPNNINICSLKFIDNDLFLTGKINASSWVSWSSIGQSNYIYPVDNKMIIAKLSSGLSVDWFRSIPGLDQSGSVHGPVKHQGNLIYYGVQESFTMDGLPFTTNGGRDLFLIDVVDNDSVNIEVKGSVFHDIDQDGMRTLIDDTVAYLEISSTAADFNSYFTNSSGEYTTSGVLGSQVVRSEEIPTYWLRSTPDSVVLNPLTYDTIVENVDFGIYPIPGIKDMTASIVPITAARPGFDAEYAVEICNVGTDTSSGIFYFNQSPFLHFISSTILPDSISADTLFYSYSNLAPLECLELRVIDSVANNTSLFWGNLVQEVHILPIIGDTVPENNTAILLHQVTGSYDPNDITVYPTCGITDDFVQNNLPLEYLIRFQNTGTDTAFTVLLKDSLSAHFDYNTFEFKDASHNAQFSIIDSALIVEFDNILLTDSTANFAESNGFFSYSIQLHQTTPIGASIENTAAIFFDYNAPVITNTVATNVSGGASLIQLTSTAATCTDNGAISFDAFCSSYGLWVKVDSGNYILNEDGAIEGVSPGDHVVSISNEFDTLGPVTINVAYNPISTSNTISICEGDSLEIAGNYQVLPGIYNDTLFTTNGCDSIILTTLNINPVTNGVQALSICEGDSIFVFNEYQSTPNIFSDTIQGISGCDSVVSTSLSFYSVIDGNQFLSVCTGDSIFVFDEYQSTPGIFSDTIQNNNGCDSVVITNLTNYSPTNGEQFLTLCSGDSIFVFDEYQSTPGIFSDTIQGNNGCDSVVSTNITLNTFNIGITNTAGILEADIVGLDYQWIDCDNNVNISGETMQFYEPLSSGEYAVVVFDGDCFDTSSCEVVIVAGTDVLNQSDFLLIYPNPAYSDFEISTSIQTNEPVRILDNIGRIVIEFKLTGEKTRVDISQLSSGIYTLHLSGVHRTFMKK